jgi:predicted permease
MYNEIFAIIAPILICSLIGYGWGYSKQPFDNELVSKLVFHIGVPCLIISKLGNADLSLNELLDIVAITVALLGMTAIAGALYCRSQSLPYRNYLPALTFANTGNMGLPLCYFAFGDPGIAIALAMFATIMIIHVTLGIALISGKNAISTCLRSPIVYSGIAACLMIACDYQLPDWLSNTVDIIGGLPIPLMLITLGISLSQLSVSDTALCTKLSIARLVIGLSVGFGLAELVGAEGVLRNVIILQSSMPVAVFNYLLAHQYQRSPQHIAGCIVISTLLGFGLLPLLIAYLIS